MDLPISASVVQISLPRKYPISKNIQKNLFFIQIEFRKGIPMWASCTIPGKVFIALPPSGMQIFGKENFVVKSIVLSLRYQLWASPGLW
jgi:hypothetical protein